MKKGQKRSLSSIEEEDGLWIQCCNENCKKWRFVKEFHDPLSVPESWVCSQNRGMKITNIILQCFKCLY